jgi:hypothetical protein
MRGSFVGRAVVVLCFAAAGALASGCQTPQPLPIARALTGAPQPSLPPSNYELAEAGTVFVWRDLNSGEIKEEHVRQSVGRMMEANFDGRRSFAYVPDPWADDENTEEADIEPLFPLEVGKEVTFHRQPRAGRAVDTVKVVRTETLVLPIGTVDTYVVETTSKIASAGWVGNATCWYAPSIRWQVQWVIEDNKGDNRRRQLIEVKGP